MTQNKTSLWQHIIVPSLGLFTSIGTLICCALPALFVTLGMGAVLAGLVVAAPWLVALSEYKIYVFSLAAILLLIATYLQWKSRNLPCPADPKSAKACNRLRNISWIILTTAIAIYLIGFFFAFIAVHIVYG